MIVRAALGLAAVTLLSSCGDDLESRQAALEQEHPRGHLDEDEDVPAPEVRRTPTVTAPTASAQGFADEDETEEPTIIEAGPESLIDNAQGFSTDPIDDTSGFDPTPNYSGGFAPETTGPESFEE